MVLGIPVLDAGDLSSDLTLRVVLGPGHPSHNTCLVIALDYVEMRFLSCLKLNFVLIFIYI